MSTELFIRICIYICLVLTLSGGVFALFSKKDFIQRIAQIIMLTALVCGILASGIFLVKDLPVLSLLVTDFSFPGTFMMDKLSAIFFFLVNTVGFLTVLYGFRYIFNEKSHYNISYLQFLSALFILGMQMVVLSTTPLFFIFAWEIMSFSSFLLVMADLKIQSVRPALFYLIMTHLGASAILAGFLLLSKGVFNLNFNQLGLSASGLPAKTILTAFLLFFFGFGSKAGLFPFHGWLPEAHPQAPSHISALMSGIMLKVAVYGFLRVILYMLPILPLWVGFLVVIVGLFSAIFGVFYSVIETDIKRILAFSSIENLGLIFSIIGIYLIAQNQQMVLLAQFSMIAVLYQSISHAFFKSGLFLVAGIAGQAFHTRNIEKMGGMARKMRIFSFAALLLSLTAAALPPSGAFVGEWLVIQSIINTVFSGIFSVKILLLGTLISFGLVAGIAVFSMVRFFGIGFLAESRSPNAEISHEPGVEMLFPVAFLSFVAFLLGAFSKPIIDIIGEDSSFIPLTFNPMILLVILLGLFLFALLFRRSGSTMKNERLYHTWDCGQPINASMEYTATTFSAPIRFFFRTILRANKKITAYPIIDTNPWLVKKSIHLEINPIWDQYFYNPLVCSITFLSSTVRRLQNGNIQFYITLILISLVITAIVTL
ncbi:hypothetical protein HYV56_01785 [Candidatus Peregrinibacteria bacterium]|nr:hypothetical protein [Candidatus Peregrinibacteria bacterium]